MKETIGEIKQVLTDLTLSVAMAAGVSAKKVAEMIHEIDGKIEYVAKITEEGRKLIERDFKAKVAKIKKKTGT